MLCREPTWPEMQNIMGGAVLDRMVRGCLSMESPVWRPQYGRDGAMLLDWEGVGRYPALRVLLFWWEGQI